MNEQITPEVMHAPINALTLIQQAMSNSDVDPDKLRALLAVKQDWEADEARKAFAQAMAKFQANAPIIKKSDDAHGKKYAALDTIWRQVRGLMDDCGLVASWQECTMAGSMIHLKGALMHKDGHSQALAYDLPMPKLITGQNEAQQMGSATTYAKRYALCSALNIVTGKDDDGNLGGAAVTRDQAETLSDLLEQTGTDLKKFLTFGKCKSLEAFPSALYGQGMALLTKKLKEGAE